MKTENSAQAIKDILPPVVNSENAYKKYAILEEHAASREDRWETMLNSALDWLYSFKSSTMKDFMEEFERRLIIHTLFKTNGNRKQAASLLGIKYTTLHEKIKKFKIRFNKMAY